jgi:hypothetical protein
MINVLLKPIRMLIGKIVYPASNTIKQEQQYVDTHNNGHKDLYIPGNSEQHQQEVWYRSAQGRQQMIIAKADTFVPAPAYFGKEFSLESYQENVYQQIKIALEKNDTVNVTGISMGGAALMLAVSRLTPEDLENKKLDVCIANTFGSLANVLADQTGILLVASFILYVMSLPLLVLSGLYLPSPPEVLMVIIGYPLLCLAGITSVVLESIAYFPSLKRIFSSVKKTALGAISKYVVRKINSDHNVWGAANQLASKDIKGINIQVLQAEGDTLITQGARLAGQLPKAVSHQITIGGHNDIPDSHEGRFANYW